MDQLPQDDQQDDVQDEQVIPEEFTLVPLPVVLQIVVGTLLVFAGNDLFFWFRLGFALIIEIIAVIMICRQRKYLNKHGDLDVVYVFEKPLPRERPKNILSRDVSDIVLSIASWCKRKIRRQG